MEILSFHCQQISSRVDGMQNTHHWSVIMTRAAMRLLIRTGGGKIKQYMFSHRTIETKRTLVRPMLAKSKLIV